MNYWEQPLALYPLIFPTMSRHLPISFEKGGRLFRYAMNAYRRNDFDQAIRLFMQAAHEINTVRKDEELAFIGLQTICYKNAILVALSKDNIREAWDLYDWVFSNDTDCGRPVRDMLVLLVSSK